MHKDKKVHVLQVVAFRPKIQNKYFTKKVIYGVWVS